MYIYIYTFEVMQGLYRQRYLATRPLREIYDTPPCLRKQKLHIVPGRLIRRIPVPAWYIHGPLKCLCTLDSLCRLCRYQNLKGPSTRAHIMYIVPQLFVYRVLRGEGISQISTWTLVGRSRWSLWGRSMTTFERSSPDFRERMPQNCIHGFQPAMEYVASYC